MTYSIRHSDLKPEYREPELVKTKCNEIESRMQEKDISIQVEWKPWDVEFYILGLEEGVTNTLHCIQHEFQVTIYYYILTTLVLIRILFDAGIKHSIIL